MKNWLITVALINLSFGASRPEAWLSKHEQNLVDLKNAPIEIKMETFSPVLNSIGEFGSVSRWGKREQNLYYNAQSLLINTPGHAHLVRDKIKKIQHEIQQRGTGYEPFRYISPVLKQLPSVETATVLSEFLDEINGNPRDWDPFTQSREVWRFGPQAASYLRDMLDDPPDISVYDREGWLAWREDVRSGKRTFRFKGGKVDYNFDGPVKSNRVAIVRENRSDTASGHSTPAPASSVSNKTGGTSSHSIDKVPRWIYFALTALILAVLGWQFCAKMKKS